MGLALVTGALAGDILSTSSFTDCGSDPSVKVDHINISYNNKDKTVMFDVAGASTKSQNVTAVLNVTAYGNQVFSKAFNPCDKDTLVKQLCPVPVGNFSARGTQEIPPEFADQIPSIAFQIPDIAAHATLQLLSLDTGAKVACIKSDVSNGKTANVPAVQYVAAGVAGAAFLVTGASAAGALFSGGGAAAGGSAAGGSGTVSPGFTEVVGWFQGMAMNGMLSVNYPPVYRSFTKNFAFSVGLIPWVGLQSSIDSFRNKTGGNLTEDNVDFVRHATMVYPDGSTSTPADGSSNVKRALASIASLVRREIETSVNDTAADAGNGENQSQFHKTVHSFERYAQEASVPKSNTFMTALLIVAIIIASIVVILLLVKVVLEVWALWGKFPQSLTGFRKHYWGSIARTITSLIMLLYGIWVLYCIFQFTQGDSWAAKALAGVTLAIFTGILGFFTWKIWSTARKMKAAEGDAKALYENKDIWVKYSLFYESYRKDYWWLFVPAILYMFAKGCTIAAGDGHGMHQTIAQLVIETLMLGLLVWSRPYERRSGNIINIVIQVVRVLSIVCIFVFVEELGVAQTTKSITGVALIAVQSTLTGVLAILICWNGINACCKANPHRKRRKDLEKQRDRDNLTPLDARDSLALLRPLSESKSFMSTSSVDIKEKDHMPYSDNPDRYYPAIPQYGANRTEAPPQNQYRNLTSADSYNHSRSDSNYSTREPTVPHVNAGYGGGHAYHGSNGYRF